MELAGKQLGHYRLLSSLGGGGMGDVYLAEDLNVPQRVVIKMVRGEADINVQANNDALRLFTREMKAIAALDHPNILSLIDFGEETFGQNTLTYMVMPYHIDGTLSDWLRRQREQSQPPLMPHEVAQLILQAAGTLQYAHDHQVLHLDVKPSNFLIRERLPRQPDLLLSDFGISRFTSASATASQSVRGTSAYMAPEQWKGLPVTATDQYALAVMAYQLLTDTLPFVGTQQQMMFEHLSTTPKPPSTLNSTLSQEVDVVILRGLAKRPEERFSSISTFANALEQACQESTEEHFSSISTFANALEQACQESTIAPGQAAPFTHFPTIPVTLPRPHTILPPRIRTLVSWGAILGLLILMVSLIIPRLSSSSITPLASRPTPTAIRLTSPTPTPTTLTSPTPTPTTLTSPTPTPTSPTPTPTTLTSPTTPNNPPASSITDLGSLNFQGYCLSIGDTSASLDQNNAYGWRCVTPSGNHVVIDTNVACQQQYNQQNVLSRMVDYSDPNNWRCYSHVKNLGSINFTQYCQSLGDGASLDGTTAYDWHCVASGNHILIDTDAACRWQYNEPDAISSVQDYFNTNGWICFGKA